MATRLLQLPATCPDDVNHRESCAKCLQDRLLVTPGIRSVSLECQPGDELANVVLHYDPRLITLGELDAEVKHAGACLSKDRAQVVLGIKGMISTRSEQTIESALSKMPGVVASASFASRSLRVEFDRRSCQLPEIARRLDELGFQLRDGGPKSAASATPKAADGRERVRDWVRLAIEYHKLAMAIVAGLLLIAAVIVKFADGPAPLRYVLVALCALLAGWYTALDTFSVLRKFHFDIDVLMFAAAIGAALLGHFEEGAFLLVLFALGGAGEELAMDRARKAIEALAKLAPDTATVRDAAGNDRLVRVNDLRIGDRIVVNPSERVPADGEVITGQSSIDQSPITGESVPVDKAPGTHVFAGTINGDGALIVGVTKLATETTLAKIVRMVQEAQTTKSPTQVFTDSVERRYVPFVLIATAGLIFIPTLVFNGAWPVWFYRAMAFLTAASPCALAIGTPAAVLSGIARAARIGVLVKGGVHLENLARLRAVAFDKTGTLTAGRPSVTRVLALDSPDEDEVLKLAAAVDISSTHPAATAIVAEARSRAIQLPTADASRQIAGRGAEAIVDGRAIYVGKLTEAVLADPRVRPLVADGLMLAQVSVDDRPICVIELAYTVRPVAAAVVRRLRTLGIEQCIMLTGDRAAVADPIARSLGIDHVHSELMPEDKVRLIDQIQRQYGATAMVGDGVNDAPALANATVGIAMGGAGTDVAIETADVALMGDDLTKLPDAIDLARFSRRIIRQNLTIALGVIAILAPLSALGFTYLGIAVLFHEGSTIVVVLNSLRLLIYKPKQS
ncbi:heavy metal translocating P-type ATPase [soil metagenome]